MEKLAMRIMLLVVMGAFLLLSGVFMDVMGSQINSTSIDGKPSLPFNPLVLVGRCVLAVGAAMLVAALFFTVRIRIGEKRRSAYQRDSTSPDILGDTVSSIHTQSYPQQTLRQNTPNPSPSRSQTVAYSDAYISQHRGYPQEAQLFGRHLMNYPSAPTLPRQHTPTLTDHHSRYSETYEDRSHIMFSRTSDSPSEALITAYRVPSRARSPYTEEEEEDFRYSRLSTERAFQPLRYNRWERQSENFPGIRSSALDPDLPPPYESTDIPPSYISVSGAQRAHNKI